MVFSGSVVRWIMLSLLLIIFTNIVCVSVASNAKFLQLLLLQISVVILILLVLPQQFTTCTITSISVTVLISEVFEVWALCSLC